MAGYGEDVYCTLLLSDSYLPGASVLAHSLRDCGTNKKLAVLVVLEHLSPHTLGDLKNLYDYVIPVDRISNPNLENLTRLHRLDLRYSFTKIALWRQTQFRKIVYMDADVVALRAPDELFHLPADFAAAPDIGWPDCFNSGVMMLTPNMGDYWALQTMASAGTSFDGADQGLLNQYFEHRKWHRLEFTYNTTPSSSYQYEPAYRYYGSRISAVHFIGTEKPWQRGRGVQGSGAYRELVARWWMVYDRHLRAPVTSASGQPSALPSSAHQYVTGEATRSDRRPPSIAITPASQATKPISAQAALLTSTEVPFTEPGETAEMIGQGHTQPTPTAEQRRLSYQWDATRSAPPAESKPEASTFPSQVYEFSQDRELFKPPPSYPEPPKDMWYAVPEEKPKFHEKPKPIFPWEENAPPPTRVFAEDLQPEPKPQLTRPDKVPDIIVDTSTAEDGPQSLPTPPRFSPSSWGNFSARSNAWDEVPGIDAYVRAVRTSQQRRGKIQVLKNELAGSGIGHPSTSLDVKSTGEAPGIPLKGRRESLVITDFPDPNDRPSLPVTPAPVRRNTFWGTDNEREAALPSAEGVPLQADWNPVERLEALRHSQGSIISLKPIPKKIPQRDLPPSSFPGRPSALKTSASTSPNETPKKPATLQRSPVGTQHHPPGGVSGGSSPHGINNVASSHGSVTILEKPTATHYVEEIRPSPSPPSQQPAPAPFLTGPPKPTFREPDFALPRGPSGKTSEAALMGDAPDLAVSPTETR